MGEPMWGAGSQHGSMLSVTQITPPKPRRLSVRSVNWANRLRKVESFSQDHTIDKGRRQGLSLGPCA